MADIELVIKIPEKIYKHILSMQFYIPGLRSGKSLLEEILKAIRTGTPLPKGHGRLIDEKEINTIVNGVFNAFDKHSPKTFLNVIHEQCIETVRADNKAKSE